MLPLKSKHEPMVKLLASINNITIITTTKSFDKMIDGTKT